MLRHDEVVDPAGRHALLYGAGGAARAVALALARGGAERVTVAVRDPARAAPARARWSGSAPRSRWSGSTRRAGRWPPTCS